MDRFPITGKINDWLIVDSDDEEKISVDVDGASKLLPIKIVSTLFDSLFLDMAKPDQVMKNLSSQNKLGDSLAGGSLYETRISKPWFSNNRHFSSISANVHGSVVNTSDRHVLDCIIAIGKMFPQELVRNQTLGNVINHYVKVENKHSPDSMIYDHDKASYETKLSFHKHVFSDRYYYYCVDLAKLLPMIPLSMHHQSRKTLKERLDRLGLTEFRVQFLDKAGENISANNEIKFKLLEPTYYTFANMAAVKSQKSQVKEEYFTHMIVGVGAGYIKSLNLDSTINRKKFIDTFGGLSNKANVLDFIKWLHINKTSYIVNKSVKDFIRAYYETKAYTGSVYITTKVNKTLLEMSLPHHRSIIENCLDCYLHCHYNDKDKLVDITLTQRKQSLDFKDN